MGLSKIAEILPKGYGCVIMVGVGSVFVIQYLGIRVGMARKQFGVEVGVSNRVIICRIYYYIYIYIYIY